MEDQLELEETQKARRRRTRKDRSQLATERHSQDLKTKRHEIDFANLKNTIRRPRKKLPSGLPMSFSAVAINENVRGERRSLPRADISEQFKL